MELQQFISEKHTGNETFVEMLLRLIDERNLKDTDVYKRANLDRKYFSKLRCNKNYKPKKKAAKKYAKDEVEEMLVPGMNDY